jgi:fatty acid desaturase
VRHGFLLALGVGYGVATRANPRRNAVAGVFEDPRRGISQRTEDNSDDRGEIVIWLLVLILLILAIGGGIALSKFLFLLLVVALVLALVGAFNRSAV